MPQLVLLRHGQSLWNAENLFTGWYDVGLTELGETEARASGRLLADEEGLDLRVLHTSALTRAIRTAELTLAEVGRGWLPVRRHWRLNERHYGALQGRNKKETAATGTCRPTPCRSPNAWPTWWPGSSPTGRTPSSPTCWPRGRGTAPSWWWPTATACAGCASTSRASATTPSSTSRSRPASPSFTTWPTTCRWSRAGTWATPRRPGPPPRRSAARPASPRARRRAGPRGTDPSPSHVGRTGVRGLRYPVRRCAPG